ncbi:MAG: hypothetical protein RLZZ54_559 [Cyanobacteriota bacterium]|jgi:hypothetical protein
MQGDAPGFIVHGYGQGTVKVRSKDGYQGAMREKDSRMGNQRFSC